MQIVIAAEQVVAHGNTVVKGAGSCEEDHDKREREDNRPVVPLHIQIDGGHIRTPDRQIKPLLQRRSCKSRLLPCHHQNYA